MPCCIILYCFLAFGLFSFHAGMNSTFFLISVIFKSFTYSKASPKSVLYRVSFAENLNYNWNPTVLNFLYQFYDWPRCLSWKFEINVLIFCWNTFKIEKNYSRTPQKCNSRDWSHLCHIARFLYNCKNASWYESLYLLLTGSPYKRVRHCGISL